jgi:hypothetical protein
MPPSASSRLTLVPTPRPHHTPLALWHLLSLDAPTVAALWTLFIARCCNLSLPSAEPAAMFVAVWIIYAADRLLDARILDNRSSAILPDIEERHRFHHRHRNRFFVFVLLASVTLVILLHSIDPQALYLYALLATLLGGWLLLIHARPLPSGTTRRLPKELAVGIFFPAAIFIPTVARLPQSQPALLPAAALLASVCTLNCLFLYAWEHPAPRLHAHWTTRWATAHLAQLACATLVITSLLLFTSALHAHNILCLTPAPALACIFSVSSLLWLNTHRHSVSSIHLRALADVALLTPLVLLSVLPLFAR